MEETVVWLTEKALIVDQDHSGMSHYALLPESAIISVQPGIDLKECVVIGIVYRLYSQHQ